MRRRPPPGRPPAVPAARLKKRLRTLIARHAGKPCPTGRDLAKQLGVNEHAVRDAFCLLETAGELQTERTAFIGGLRRRMRVKVKGAWSEWTRLTRKRTTRLTLDPDCLLAGDAHHVAKVLHAGRY